LWQTKGRWEGGSQASERSSSCKLRLHGTHNRWMSGGDFGEGESVRVWTRTTPRTQAGVGFTSRMNPTRSLEQTSSILLEHRLPYHGPQEMLVQAWLSGGALHPDPGTQDILPSVSFLGAIRQRRGHTRHFSSHQLSGHHSLMQCV
jgi:hypothetical protein